MLTAKVRCRSDVPGVFGLNLNYCIFKVSKQHRSMIGESENTSD